MNKKVVLAWVPSHVDIKGNEKADELAKQALKVLSGLVVSKFGI